MKQLTTAVFVLFFTLNSTAQNYFQLADSVEADLHKVKLGFGGSCDLPFVNPQVKNNNKVVFNARHNMKFQLDFYTTLSAPFYSLLNFEFENVKKYENWFTQKYKTLNPKVTIENLQEDTERGFVILKIKEAVPTYVLIGKINDQFLSIKVTNNELEEYNLLNTFYDLFIANRHAVRNNLLVDADIKKDL
jgi:hypothetical protein